MLVYVSTGRAEFFSWMHGGQDLHAAALRAYGEADVMPALEGGHTEVVQRVCTGRDPDVAAHIAANLE